MKAPESTIVLCAGPINYTNLPIGTNLSNAMIPVNGKPVIGWILDDLLSKGLHQVTLVLRQENHRLSAFVQRAYAGRLQIRLAPVPRPGTIVESLQIGLRRSPTEGLVRIILGDTLIPDPFEGDRDFVYVGAVEDAGRWCLAVLGEAGQIIDYLDKQEAGSGKQPALAGYYHLCHGAHLQACVEASITSGVSELSEVLRRYGVAHPIEARPVQEWYDFGHIDNLVDARRRLLRPRYFNSLTINPVLNTVTKVSQNNEKLRDELEWYLALPEELKVLTPRLISHQPFDGHVEIVQEYYGYPTLAELYLYGDLPAETWRSILRHVLRIHRELRHYPGQLDPDEIESMYVGKTLRRLADQRCQSSEWSDWLARSEVVFNGERLRGITALEADLRVRALGLANSAPVSIIHGDFCFSNILFDLNNQIIRLVDPRGRFGRKGLYGDARYDIAKLRHSACDGYDFIVADMFDLRETPSGWDGELFEAGELPAVAKALDQMLVEAGYDLGEIKFIEGLLFVSMLPLHHGQPRRQKMMYLTGLQLLNEVL